MPREIVRIRFTSKFPVGVGVRFFATIAYPDNQNNRERYQLALSRLAVLARAKGDLEFANTLFHIVPQIFVASDYDCLKILKRGNRKLEQHVAAAKWLVMPHFRDDRLKPLQVKKDGEFIIPTLNKMTLVAMDELCWVGNIKSAPTFKIEDLGLCASNRTCRRSVRARLLLRGPRLSY